MTQEEAFIEAKRILLSWGKSYLFAGIDYSKVRIAYPNDFNEVGTALSALLKECQALESNRLLYGGPIGQKIKGVLPSTLNA